MPKHPALDNKSHQRTGGQGDNPPEGIVAGKAVQDMHPSLKEGSSRPNPGVYGSTGLFPFLLIQIQSDVHTVSAPLCFLQDFCLYSYGSVEFLTLAVMSYDRYVAICFPLQYNTLVTSKKTVRLVVIMWFYPFFTVVILVSMTASLQLCGNIINKVYCDNSSIVKLACFNITVINIYGLVDTFLLIVFPAVLIFYTYMSIIKVCFSGSKQTRQKAASTCTPHLVSLLNFSFGCFFEVLENRVKMNSVSGVLLAVKTSASIFFIICQTVFNPFLYGLKISRIRISCKSLVGKILRHF
uniref:Olfactory receptor n=1 Tax=Austrofundulus limnaeus TaxID=52670 RepID=A0A2I4C8D8_AUSLI